MSRLLSFVVVVVVIALLAVLTSAGGPGDCISCRMYADRLNSFLSYPRREHDFEMFLDQLHRTIPRSDDIYNKLHSFGMNKVKQDLDEYYTKGGPSKVCGEWEFC